MKPGIAVAYRFQHLVNQNSSVTCMGAQMPRAQDAAEKLPLRLSSEGSLIHRRLRAPHFRHPWRSQERLDIGGSI